MATFTLSLINETNEKVIKTYIITDGTYTEAEEKCFKFNQKINKKPNPKELYWSITGIGR